MQDIVWGIGKGERYHQERFFISRDLAIEAGRELYGDNFYVAKLQRDDINLADAFDLNTIMYALTEFEDVQPHPVNNPANKSDLYERLAQFHPVEGLAMAIRKAVEGWQEEQRVLLYRWWPDNILEEEHIT